MSSSTTIILVPGAWHKPDCFPPNFNPDVDVIRKHIEAAADAGQDVVVVAHSYGSIPTSEAIKGLDLKSRQAAGKKGGVVHFFFLSAHITRRTGLINSSQYIGVFVAKSM
ncbi:hypothetical protein Slin15195_G057030 [Septoria linicola]|uniref:AB hydrolase-1 domain-containing protein n=1 Tax=Septoria linicola TaxID=215465 RepID=A0A9Q9AN65_9PEZI|nr:hypothetical protein Slin15195_G057030 [Septoria linicola]